MSDDEPACSEATNSTMAATSVSEPTRPIGSAVRTFLDSSAVDDSRVHIFWDHSNLFARMQDTCDPKDPKDGVGFEPGHRFDARLSFPVVFEFASCGRDVEKAVAVGSIPPDLKLLWERLGNVGMIVDLQERGAQTGKEVAVDEALENEMLKSIIDSKPAVAVLLSGDGGFRPTLDRMLKAGWGVEVLSFSRGFSPKLQQIARGSDGRGKYVRLDRWYKELTYLQELGGNVIRRPEPLDMRRRPHV